MDLGISKVIKEGNGNTLIYTALLAGIIANTVPTPFDSIYFRRVNKLQKDYKDKKITAKNLEWHIGLEYYFWTSLWYGALFTGIYSFGGEYKTNTKILLGMVGAGLVVGAIKKNIQLDEEYEKNS